jgi:hypothetical protein
MERQEELAEKPKRPFYSEAELGETFGDFEIIKVPVDNLVILPQTRLRVNPVQSKLAESIRNEKLMNQVDIALLTPEQLENHLEFINSIWKTKATIADYEQPNNGVYPVLIAGHSRVAAVKSIELNEGSPKSICVKIHNITTSAEFLNLQLIENTHADINPERRAIAIVEMYFYGYDKNAKSNDYDHWSSYDDFAKKNTGFSKEMISDGIAFAKLSPDTRDYVFAEKLYYGAGVELGKNADTIRDYATFSLGETATEQEIDQAYNYELERMINHLIDSRVNSKGGQKKALAYINEQVSYMKDVITPKNEDDNSGQLQLNAFFNSPNEQRETYLRELDKRHRDILGQIKKRPVDFAIECLELDAALTGNDPTEDIREVRQAYMNHIGKHVIKALGISTQDETKK